MHRITLPFSKPFLAIMFMSQLYATCVAFHETPSLNAVIADYVVEMNSSYPAPNNPPAGPETKSCQRAHQGLFNECLTYTESNNDQVQLTFPEVVYGFDQLTQEPRNSFWAHAAQIFLLKNLSPQVRNTIPNPVYGQEPTIVLTYPWNNFSVGTRFKRLSCYDTTQLYGVVYADFAHNAIKYDQIPYACGMPEIKRDAVSSRYLFVDLINTLIDKVTQDQGVIAYVWGGSSFITPYKQPDFCQEDGVWQRNGKNNLYTGYDCSEFVMRMAKIAGIHFPWKTTSAIERKCPELTANDTLHEGDLIWVKEHIMIVSNLERNELIQARGYSSGYGCVNRITLADCFEGIETYHDLLAYRDARKSLQFKNKTGNVLEKKYPFKLLKLISDTHAY